jgi:hypothetical protein
LYKKKIEGNTVHSHFYVFLLCERTPNDLAIILQAYERLGMHEEAKAAALQADNNGDELFSRLKFTLGQNALIDTLRDRFSSQGTY